MESVFIIIIPAAAQFPYLRCPGGNEKEEEKSKVFHR